jgi:hypothetical protein
MTGDAEEACIIGVLPPADPIKPGPFIIIIPGPNGPIGVLLVVVVVVVVVWEPGSLTTVATLIFSSLSIMPKRNGTMEAHEDDGVNVVLVLAVVVVEEWEHSWHSSW